MKIGIIGDGVVGGACKFGFELLGHNVAVHDIKYGTQLEVILDTEVVYICVPTPSNKDGSCNTDTVESVLQELDTRKYQGLVAVKSTVVPGTIKELKSATNLRLCFVPEFLRERCAITDFTENHDVCIIGADNVEDFELIKECHGTFPEKFVHLSPTEAEFCKYFNNVYNAMLVVFANSFYKACKLKGADYTKVKNAVINRRHISGNYLECNENFKGFGGMCLPKDVAAMACMMKDTNVGFFETLLEENGKCRITVFEGMRK